MNIFVYGDESGVFDCLHYEYFVFGGVIFLDKTNRDVAYRKFVSAEKKIASQYGQQELKACRLKPKHKEGLYRSTNQLIRYAFIIDQREVLSEVFLNKKSKQRYLDFVYKVGLRRCLERLIALGFIQADSVDAIYIRLDEHTTATDGRYELKEGIEAELKHGTYNYNYSKYFPPLFPCMRGGVVLEFRDSLHDALIRASDVVANHVYYRVRNGQRESLQSQMNLVYFPECVLDPEVPVGLSDRSGFCEEDSDFDARIEADAATNKNRPEA